MTTVLVTVTAILRVIASLRVTRVRMKVHAGRYIFATSLVLRANRLALVCVCMCALAMAPMVRIRVKVRVLVRVAGDCEDAKIEYR